MTNRPENDAVQGRIEELEKQLADLRGRIPIRGSDTPLMPVFMFAALGAFIAFVANIPLPGSPDEKQRFMVGVASGLGGALILGGALTFVNFALRAVLELLFVMLLLTSASTGVVVWASWSFLTDSLVGLGVSEDNVRVAAVLTWAVTTFVFDVAVSMVLYPLARVAGSNVVDP